MIKKIKVDRDWQVRERMARLDHTFVTCEFCNKTYQLGNLWSRLSHWFYCHSFKKFSGMKDKQVFIITKD